MTKKSAAICINAFSSASERTEYIPLLTVDEDDAPSIDINEEGLPILAIRNMVLFPGVILPISVGRKKSLKLVKEAYKKGLSIGAIAQKDKNIEDPTTNDLFTIGTVAQVVKVLEMPDGSTTVILQGQKIFEVGEYTSTDPYFVASIKILDEVRANFKQKNVKALIEAIKDLTLRMSRISGNFSQEFSFAIKNIDSSDFLINYVSSNAALTLDEKQTLLETTNMLERAQKLLEMLTRESQLLEIKASIQSKAMENIDKQQREYFLQQQMKSIQKELGGSLSEQEVSAIRQKASTKKWDDKTKQLVEKEIDKLENMTSHSGDYPMQMNYVQTLIDLPWNEYTKDNFNLKRAQKILDRDHFGLDDVKERIIEHLSVLKLKGDMKSPIICLYGPPGVGKTSLGKSVAEALGRKYARISLGGLHDEAEIRGHRRTYIGAMPGRIIDNIKKVGSSNPVFILDEIDKIGSDFKGDPSSALLEVLDPEQNGAFHDNYIDIDFDLSKVLFIATANTLSSISTPLLDRMELIPISGYIVEEKIEIAKKYLIPKQFEANGIASTAIKLSKEAIKAIIEQYTRESGVRALEKQIAKIARRVAKKLAFGETLETEITPAMLYDYLGVSKFDPSEQDSKEEIGIVTGLAWTSVGGDILEIESDLSKGKGDKFTLTGNLGDVMKESATIALEYIRAHQEELGIADDFFDKHNIHLHVPEGAIPKDGPSAGITIATSLLSAITKRKVRKHIAMTGEITLHGKVLPVGGIKEKILAAKRAGVKDILLCEKNKKDIDEIKPIYLKGVQFHYVKTLEDVFAFALLPN